MYLQAFFGGVKRRKQNQKISFQFFAAPPAPLAVFLKGKEIFGFACATGGSTPEARWSWFVRSVRTHEIKSTQSVPLSILDFLQRKFGFRPKGTATNKVSEGEEKAKSFAFVRDLKVGVMCEFCEVKANTAR